MRLRGSVVPEQTLARLGAERLWELLRREEPVARARRAHRRPGRADGEGRASRRSTSRAGRSPPTRTSPAAPTPTRASIRRTACRRSCKRLNNALLRADQIDWSEGRNGTHWLAPIVADAEAGFGGPLNAYELMRSMIEAGAAGVHFEDQLASEKKCGHLGGKVLVPTAQFVRTLNAARLAADVLDVPTVLVARTDALSAALLTSDVDEYDREFVTGERTAEGFFRVRDGLDAAIARGARVRAVRRPDLVRDVDARPRRGARVRARRSTRSSRASCSRTTARRRSTGGKHLDDDADRDASRSSSARWGYRFQFITLAGFHSLNAAMFELARGYAAERHARVRRAAGARVRARGARLHGDAPPARGRRRLLRPRHAGGLAATRSTLALEGSTEEAQFSAGERGRSSDGDPHDARRSRSSSASTAS